MPMKEDGQCDCICHKPGKRALHIMPCCHECPHCGKNFADPFHARKCPKNPEPKKVKKLDRVE